MSCFVVNMHTLGGRVRQLCWEKAVAMGGAVEKRRGIEKRRVQGWVAVSLCRLAA
jgi:hypothetical protein